MTYCASSVAMFAFGIISIEVWPTEFPVWAFILALVIGKLSIAHNINID